MRILNIGKLRPRDYWERRPFWYKYVVHIWHWWNDGHKGVWGSVMMMEGVESLTMSKNCYCGNQML